MVHRVARRLLRRLDRLRPETEEGSVLARGASLAFMLQVTGAALAYFMQLLFARWLGAAHFGAYTYTVGWSTLLAVLTGLGLSTAVLQFIPAYVSGGDWARLGGILRVSLLATVLASLIISILGTVLVVWLHSHGITTTWNGLLGVWMVPVAAIMTLQQETARAFRNIGLAYAPSLVLRPLFAIAAGLLYFALGLHLQSTIALSITLASILLTVAVQALGLWRQLPIPVRTSKPRYDTRRWLRAAFPLLFVAGFIVVLMQTDVVMVGAIMGPRAAGLYGAAAKTASLAGLVLIAVNAIAAPVYSSLFAQGRHDDIQRLASDTAQWIFWPSFVIGVILAIFSEQILELFGTAFAAAHWQLTILLVGQIVSAGAGSVGWLMLVTGHQDQAAWVYGWIALIHVALLGIAIPVLGTTGAALATTISFTLWNVWLYALVVRRLHIHPSVLYALRRDGHPPFNPR